MEELCISDLSKILCFIKVNLLGVCLFLKNDIVKPLCLKKTIWARGEAASLDIITCRFIKKNIRHAHYNAYVDDTNITTYISSKV